MADDNIYTRLLDQDAGQPRIPAGESFLPPAQLTTPDTDNIYARLLDQDEEQERARVNTAVRLAEQTDPDAAARAKVLARSLNLPVETVERNMPQAEGLQRDRNLDRLKGTSPILWRQLSDPEFAKLARDDIGGLGEIEKSLSWLGASAKAGGYDLLAAGAKILDAANPWTLTDQDAATLFKNDPSKLAWYRDESPATILSRFARQRNQDAEEAMRSVPPAVQSEFGGLEYATTDPSKAAWASPTKMTGDILRSLPSTLALAASVYLTRGAAIKAEGQAMASGATAEAVREAGVQAAAAMAARVGAVSEGTIGYAQQALQTQAQVENLPPDVIARSPEYQRLITAGFDPGAARLYIASQTAEQAGLGAGAVDAITNMIGGRYLGKVIGEGGSLLPRMARGGAAEGITEFVQGGGEQLAQNIAVQQSVSPDQQPGDGVLESMVQGLLVGGLTGGIFAAVGARAQKAQAAGPQADAVAALTTAAKASKVLQRDPESFQQFVASAAEDGPVQQVFIDANTLMQSGVAEQVSALSPSVAAQLPDAAQTGGQIAIPVEEYATRIAPTKYAQDLLNHIKTDPEGFSRAEADVYMQGQAEELKAEMDRVLAEQEGDSRFRQSADAVRSSIKDQLDTAGRFTPQVNDSYASLVGRFYAVKAASLGIMPEELAQRLPLKIVAELPEGGRRFAQGENSAPDATTDSSGLAGTDSRRADAGGSVATIGGEEIAPRSADTKALRAAARAWYETNLRGTDVVNEASGREVKFMNAKKAFATSADPDKLRLFAALRKIVAKGEIKNSVQPTDLAKEPDTKAYHWLEAVVDMNGTLTHVGVTLREDSNGNLYYNHNPIKEKAPTDLRRSRPAHKAARYTDGGALEESHPSEEGEAFEQNIAPDDDGINLHVLTQGPRGAYSPDTLTITLLKSADLSTFLHETGHFFLDMLERLATDPASPNVIRDDMDAALRWIGVAGETPDARLAAWRGMSLEEKRPGHEKWARGFEAYLFEGKAPSIELHGLFQRFRAWILNVYRDLKALDVKLTPEVRGVFDRMLATGDQIALAEQGRSMMPLFETAEQAGMSIDEFRAYHELSLDATAEAIEKHQARLLRDMQWLSGARSNYIKKLQSKNNKIRKEMRRTVADEVNAQPIYRADGFLRYGELEIPSGASQTVRRAEEQANLEGTKLSLPALKEMYGEAENAIWRYLPTGKHGLAATEGLHPDTVADIFGFTSGDELVRKLLAAAPRNAEIDSITDRRMLEQYGELSTPEGIERAADAAVHNVARARLVATEANALARLSAGPLRQTGVDRNGRPLMKRILPDAAKNYAREITGRQKIRDLRPDQYTGAEARAARAAQKALKSGNLELAATEKRNQLIQNQLAQAAIEVREEVERGLRYLRKAGRPGKNMDADCADQINNLLERFNLRSGQSNKAVDNKAVDKRAALAAWLKRQRDAGFEPNIPEEIENEAFRTSYKNMTVEEFRGLVDTVKQIEHLGKLKHKLLTAADQRAYEAARDEIANSIHDNAGDRAADTRTPTTNAGRAVQGIKLFWAAHIKAATWARVLDGGKDGGPMWEYFIRTANECGDKETTMRADATARLSEILAPVFALGKMGGRGKYFPSIGRSLNREARISIALNTGNEGNLQRLLGGEGWTVKQIAPVLQSLTAVEWLAVQQIWDHFDSYRSQIAAKERRIYGVEPEWVEPVPFTVQTADGQAVDLRGGYYPIKYDPVASQRTEEHADAEDARRQMQGAYTSATTRRSFTKSRVEEVYGRPLLYTLSGLYSGVNDVIHDLAWHEWLIDANRLLRSQTIDKAIREHYGSEVKQQFKTWVQDVAEGDKGAADVTELSLGRLRQGVSIAGLGFNVMSAFMQPLGITQSIVRVGATWVGRGVWKYIAHPVALTRQVNGMSDFMANRARTRFRELNELRNQVQDQSALKEKVGRYAYFLMMRMQQAVDVPTWWGAYEKAMAEGNDENRAIALADQAVIDAQGGGQTKDLSAIERGSPATKLFTVFYSFMNTALNIGAAQTMTANTTAKRARLAVDHALIYVIPAILGAALKDALTPGDSGDWDDPEKIAGKLIAAQIDYLMGLMFLVREFSDAAKMGLMFLVREFSDKAATGLDANGYSGPSGVRLIPDMTKFAQQASQGEFDDAFRKSFINVMGELLGLPAAQVNRTISGTKALAEGKTSNPAALAFGFQEER